LGELRWIWGKLETAHHLFIITEGVSIIEGVLIADDKGRRPVDQGASAIVVFKSRSVAAGQRAADNSGAAKDCWSGSREDRNTGGRWHQPRVRHSKSALPGRAGRMRTGWLRLGHAGVARAQSRFCTTMLRGHCGG
jgi:hypothetical protein